MLPDTAEAQAALLAERLREAVETKMALEFSPIPDGITVSIGVAALDDNVTTAKELTKRAGPALYQAQWSGRN
ncbi:GGDEF domain-containing protein, partial [Luminiphilus syltensis]|uniref:GGDEF domain-containing protein n=1 Tax=Luminiphilus syltensis TaxID=1341119 RepID=UPI0005914631